MIILHAAPIVWTHVGGLRASIPALVSSQNRLPDVQAALMVTAARPGQPPALDFPVFNRKARLGGRNRLGLPAPFARPDLVVFHSTYIPVHASIAAGLHKAGIPYFLCPRGGMTRYAQTHRRWKKRIANLMFFNKLVARAAAVNCLTPGEAQASGGWNRPVFVVGNGVRVPPPSALASPGRSARRRFVFIGRLAVHHKGLDIFLKACAIARPELRALGGQVELYGPDWRGSTRFLSNRIRGLRLEDVVSLHGPILAERKATVLKQADVFLHTSRFEGHPNGVLEALSYGVPCLLTPGTNLAEEVATVGAGWGVEPSVEGIAAGLRDAVTADGRQLAELGASARRLAVRNYDWQNIAFRSVHAYRKYAA